MNYNYAVKLLYGNKFVVYIFVINLLYRNVDT